MNIDYDIATVYEVMDSEIETLALNSYAISFQFHSMMECGNSTYHRFDVTGEVADEDQFYVDEIENHLRVHTNKIDVLLNWLASQGDLETGIYYISAWH